MSILTRSSRSTETPEARALAEAEAHLAQVRAKPLPVDGGVAGLDSGLLGPEQLRIHHAAAEVALRVRKLAEQRWNAGEHLRLVRAELAQARAEATTATSTAIRRRAEDDATYWQASLSEAEAEVQRYAEPTAS